MSHFAEIRSDEASAWGKGVVVTLREGGPVLPTGLAEVRLGAACVLFGLERGLRYVELNVTDREERLGFKNTCSHLEKWDQNFL